MKRGIEMARSSFEGEIPEEQIEVCPVTDTQNVIAGKWKIIILWHLRETRRFGELQRLVPGISKAILTSQLRELEKDQMVNRVVYQEVPPKVEYRLTDWGQSLCPALDAILKWADRRPQS